MYLTPMITLTNLSVYYKQKNEINYALKDVSFTIPRGSTCTVIGPSGCGKSTLLSVLSGLHHDYSGEVLLDGAKIYQPQRRTALILQSHGLLPWKTVWNNAVLGLEIRGVAKKLINEKVSPILQNLGLWEMRDRYPSQLSGGQRQRIGIARALALDPDLLLMDEPFSALDALTRESLQKQLLSIWLNNKMTIVLVTHSIEEAIFMGQKIIIFSAHPGRVIAVIDNPRAGEMDYRKSKEFHEVATKVREILEN